MKNQIYYVEDIEPLVDEYHGNVAAIARHLGASRNTIYNRIRESAGLQRAINDARQTMVDEAESSLYTAVLDGNMTAIIFFLKTQGKDRGYVERQEIGGRDGNDIVIRVVYDGNNGTSEEST